MGLRSEQSEHLIVRTRAAALESPHSGHVGFNDSSPLSSYPQRRHGR